MQLIPLCTVMAVLTSSAVASTDSFEVHMPGVKPTKHDAYMCTSQRIPAVGTQYVVGFEPLADMHTVHHMLVFACSEPASSKTSWYCGTECKGEKSYLFAWAKNAPAKQLPEDVGFMIGGETSFKYIVMQIHYAKTFKSYEEGDHSGLRLHTTSTRPSQLAGIFLLGGYGKIPPHLKEAHIDISCRYDGNNELHALAFRTHAHKIGRVIFAYHKNSSGHHLIGKGNPQWAQAFYPANSDVVLKQGDSVVARCIYDTSTRSKDTYFGQTDDDEMCNFYLMFYTAADKPPRQPQCWGDHLPGAWSGVPDSANELLPDTPPTSFDHGLPGFNVKPKEPELTTEAAETGSETESPKAVELEVVKNWLSEAELKKYSVDLGQIGGLATDIRGNLYIFHRGPVVWDLTSFRGLEYAHKDKQITQSTIIQVDRDGKIVDQFGNDFYYMPHGITVDPAGRIWTTDVAMHQIFRYDAGAKLPTFSLGERFVHGDDTTHFCQPADVAVLPSGEFFVADGYCNSRVSKFDANGRFIASFGKLSAEVGVAGPAPGVLRVPHGVTTSPDDGLVWVADRENGRLQCFDANTLAFKYETEPGLFGEVYAVQYCPLHGGMLYAVNANMRRDPKIKVQGYTLRASDGKLLSTWGSDMKFERLHDVAFFSADESVYVADLDRGVVKFTTAENLALIPTTVPPHDKPKDDDGKYLTNKNVQTSGEKVSPKSDKSSRQASLIIGLLLIIPVIAMIVIAIVVKCRTKNKFRNRTSGWGNGFFRKGFERLNQDDSDQECNRLTDSDFEGAGKI